MDKNASDTGKNRNPDAETQKPKKPGTFEKNDPRINRKGRPRTFDQMRELAQAIAHEAVGGDEGPLVIGGKVVTRAELILRRWASSQNPALQMRFMEVCFGKVPQPVEHSGPNGGPIEGAVTVKDWEKSRDARSREAMQTLEAMEPEDDSGDDEFSGGVEFGGGPDTEEGETEPENAGE